MKDDGILPEGDDTQSDGPPEDVGRNDQTETSEGESDEDVEGETDVATTGPQNPISLAVRSVLSVFLVVSIQFIFYLIRAIT